MRKTEVVICNDEAVDEQSVLAQARELASPRRYQLLRQVIGAGPAGVGVAELADRFRLTRTAVRLHLARLVACGLLAAESSSSGGRGRPRIRYRATPAAERWAGGDPFEQLTRVLTRQGDEGPYGSTATPAYTSSVN